MNIHTTSNFEKKYRKLRLQNKNLSSSLDKTYKLLRENPHHPSLRLHKLTGREGTWSISINRSIRAIFKYVSDGMKFVDLGSHDEVYSKK
ncbi:type II toxin-antitoxin system mRNA interferase toxin, RelE/StbE family [Candidatus Roizmanbacteria bacterium]|nr:type II toxin-antitoxin system mRNA interferase toxin, RelE/StbE family [Candidatus Roizmanbacteria bacterium]